MYSVIPLHEFVFGGMLRGISKTAEAMHRSNVSPQKETPPTERNSGIWTRQTLAGNFRVGCIVTLSATALFFNLPEQFFSGPHRRTEHPDQRHSFIHP